MKLLYLSFICAFVFLFAGLKSTTAQKQVKEATLIYSLSFFNPNAGDSTLINEAAELKIWVKADQSRSETIYQTGKETTIFNQENNKGVILREFRGQELLIPLSGDNWMEKNALFQQAKFTLTDSIHKINGISCRKAIAFTKGGKIVVYYNSDLLITNTKFDLAFPDLKGLAVRVEWIGNTNDSTSMAFNLKQIFYDNIPQTKFDFPSTEKLKTISFEEAKKGKG